MEKKEELGFKIEKPYSEWNMLDHLAWGFLYWGGKIKEVLGKGLTERERDLDLD